MELKIRVQELLKERKMTSRALAERIGWQPAQLCMNLKSVNPTLVMLDKIACGLGVETWELFISREELNAERERRHSARMRQVVALTTTCPCCGAPVCIRSLADVNR